MRISLSNIAWDIQEDPQVAKILGSFGIDAIDIAPGKYFPDPTNVKDVDVINIKRWWAAHGIEIVGMQSLLFGTIGFNVFGSKKSQEAMLEHLRAVCNVGACLGATRLVFGSPRNRDRSGWSDNKALDQAIGFFTQLGSIAQEQGVIVCLEPNPIRYGANFMTNSEDTARVVTAVNHSAIRMQFDTGALTINREMPETVLAHNGSIVGHVHASEPDLLPLGDGTTDHRQMHKALLQYLPQHPVSIEMVATKNEPHLQSIERALTCAIEWYCPERRTI